MVTEPSWSPEDLDLLYEDEELVAVSKPGGLLVHRTRLARDERVSLLPLLRERTGKFLFPATL